jgi:peptidoglycan/xylan/chitin deacetylase (PgdA/CDA1 family)
MKLSTLKDNVLRPLINIIPFSLIRQIGSSKLIVLYYHIVNDEDVPHISNLYKYKCTGQFIDDLEFLLQQYSPIGLSDVIAWMRGKKNLIPNSFLLTFDDGLRDIFDVIAPILSKKGIPATFFISSAFLDNQELCYLHKASLLVEKLRKGISRGDEVEISKILVKSDFYFSQLYDGVQKIDYSRREALDRIADILQVDFQGYLNDKKPYLTSFQVKELIDRGFAIGAHSIDHPYYSDLSLEEQLVQTLVSVKQIRESFALEYGAFAFPHNDAGVSPEFFKKVQESGLVDITFGTGGMQDAGLQSHLQRISLEKPLLSARELIAWQYMRNIFKKLNGSYSTKKSRLQTGA